MSKRNIVGGTGYMGILRSGLSEEMTLTVDLELQQHWDQKLRNPWGMAPGELIKKGGVNAQNYAEQNRQFGKFCSKYVVREVQEIRKGLGPEILLNEVVAVFGIGRAYDWKFVRSANDAGLEIMAYDVSNVACAHGRRYFNRLYRSKPCSFRGINNTVHLAEVEDLCTDGLQPYVCAVYASRFLQFQPLKKMQNIMRGLGKYLAHAGRRIILVHPFPEDNPTVAWGSTHPYTLDEILGPTQEGLDSEKLVVVRTEKGSYYHQTYTAFTLMKAV